MYLEICWVVTAASFRDTILMLAVYEQVDYWAAQDVPPADKGHSYIGVVVVCIANCQK